MIVTKLQWFLIGWIFGAGLQWGLLAFDGLIRTREEWEEARRKKGKL